ncbi:hypothetical protein CPB84DRAFT_1760296 [Gymnopilus junonius]|uniref:RRM domain-containing protein n=1 Tax=Gymnopilus junonius TaxID=109634 RepID=A0A9P5P365_GYMJU|nr:hypothetical protein CPB84DRAFT_1760296 [Gymnopilus junonius]
MSLNNTSPSSFSGRPADDKLPHDASVFVGSLPSNIDQGDLTRMLVEHLSEHTQIKNIKVVRDSKGGVCAFVQCENAISANALIQILHSSARKPFLGRILRYEPARAFRSLIISYRTPTQFVTSSGTTMNIPTPVCGEMELDLPYAMRVWKQKNLRFHNILYNAEAIQSEENHKHTADVSVLDGILFLHPLKFDEETLHKLMSYFGPLEKFGSVECPKINDANTSLPIPSKAADIFSEPHRAPRSPSMDPSCWEIKWEHRDDCVSALMTLKRVPHLTVTWAHQPMPMPLGKVNRSNHHQNFIPPTWSFHSHRASSSYSSVPESLCILPTFKQSVEGDKDIDPLTEQIVGGETSKGDCAELTVKHNGGSSTLIAQDNEILPDNSNMPLRPQSAVRDHSGVMNLDARQETSIAHHTGSSERDSFSNFNRFPDSAQDLYIPQTPTLDSSTITPLSQGSHFPPTPTSPGAEILQGMSHKYLGVKETPMSFKSFRPNREIDPTTLFVGGLEMFGPGAWDEERVRTFFSRFGGLESVKLVRPLNRSTSNPSEFPQHNRIYEGRTIRVQLRDYPFTHEQCRLRAPARFNGGRTPRLERARKRCFFTPGPINSSSGKNYQSPPKRIRLKNIGNVLTKCLTIPGYPVYPRRPQQPHSTLTTPSGSEVGNPSTPSYIPYPTITSQGQLPPPHINSQAPRCTHWIYTKRAGTLIAVISLNGNIPVTPFTPTVRSKAPPSQHFSTAKHENRRPFHATPPAFHHRQAVDRRENHHSLSSVRQPRSFGGGHSNRSQMHPSQTHTNLRYQAVQSGIPGDWNGWNNTR